MCRASRALRRPSCRGRARGTARRGRRIRRGVRRACGRRAHRGRPPPVTRRRRGRTRLGTHARARPGAGPAGAVRARQSGRHAARRRLRGVEPTRWARGGTCASASASTSATRGSAIAFGLGGQLDRLRGDGRYDLVFRLKENRWNGTVAPQLVVRRLFDAPEAYQEVRASSPGSGASGREAWTPEARRVFAELGLTRSGGRRELSSRRLFGRCSGRGAAAGGLSVATLRRCQGSRSDARNGRSHLAARSSSDRRRRMRLRSTMRRMSRTGCHVRRAFRRSFP